MNSGGRQFHFHLSLPSVFLLLLLGLAGCRKDTPPPETPALVWTALNVNAQSQQGDAHLLQIGRDTALLIDCGHIQYADALLQGLRARHVARLQAVIVSHGHRDHYGGLWPLLCSEIAVEQVYFNPPTRAQIEAEPWGCATDEIGALTNALAERHIPLLPLTTNTQWQWDGHIALRVLCVYDGLHTPIGPTDINDMSAVLRLTHNRLTYLFTGDLNAPLGAYLARTQPETLRADILKVPHHGTEGLAPEAFFDAVAPRAMIVPAPAALWQSERSARVRTRAEHVPTYINGLHGDITVLSFGDRYRIETQTNRVQTAAPVETPPATKAN